MTLPSQTMAVDLSQNGLEDAPKNGQSNFHLAFAFLPKAKRQAMFDFYSYCRYADDIVDELAVQSMEAAQKSMVDLRQEVERVYSGSPLTNLGKRLQNITQTYAIQKQNLVDILDGCEMDFEDRSYETFEDLYQYCYRVASAVGLVSIEIFGYSQPSTKEFAINLGLAFQLTNILRDIDEDSKRNRIYLPQEDLQRFEYSKQDLKDKKVNANFLNLIHFESARAHAFYRKAYEVLEATDRRKMLAAHVMKSVYFKILKKIEKNPGDIFKGRVRLSKAHKLFLASRTLLKVICS